MAEPILCAKGCGFYGSAENRNLCSKCYKDFVKEELLNAKPIESSSTENQVVSENDVAEGTTGYNNLKNRCRNCNKKVGLTGFRCRCGNVFCGRHRLPEEHACTQDFKAAAREKLKLVRIQGDKLKSRV